MFSFIPDWLASDTHSAIGCRCDRNEPLVKKLKKDSGPKFGFVQDEKEEDSEIVVKSIKPLGMADLKEWEHFHPGNLFQLTQVSVSFKM